MDAWLETSSTSEDLAKKLSVACLVLQAMRSRSFKRPSLLVSAAHVALQRSQEEGGLQLRRHLERTGHHGVPRSHQAGLRLLQVSSNTTCHW